MERPPARIPVSDSDRRHVRTWSDAAGASRWIAAVMEEDGAFWWTRLLVPPEIWEQLLPREDDQIGVQECLGIALALETFRGSLRHNL